MLSRRAGYVGAENPRVHLYTYTDLVPHPGVCLLAEAASELGFELRVIGLSRKPGYILVHDDSPTLKFLLLQETIEYEVDVGRILPDDLAIFADGHDVFLQRSLGDLLSAYRRWPDSPYLISGEKNCWPWPHTDPSHGDWNSAMSGANYSVRVHKWFQVSANELCNAIPRKGPYRYPNIGLSMGPVHRFLAVLKRNNRIVMDEGSVDDQGAMWLVIIRHAEELNIEIDQNADVFLSMVQYVPGEMEREPCGNDWFADRADPTTDEKFDGYGYEMTASAKYCADNDDLTSPEECEKVASSLGIRWGGVFYGVEDHRSCLHTDDGRDAIFFNSAGKLSSLIAPNRYYRSVCRKAKPSKAKPRVFNRDPPRNLLTNTTPALVHFNGPSHEDETWVKCYHVWRDQFRALDRGHYLIDIDHSVVLPTDVMCDYTPFTISSYHSHPIDSADLEFMKALHNMPVDPGLLAWRNSSAVDKADVSKLRIRMPWLHGGPLKH